MTPSTGTNSGHSLPDPSRGAAVLADDRAHVFHSWSAQASLNPTPIAGGLGCTIWDYEGNEWLDFSSQLVNTNIGHQHPEVVAAIQKAAGELCTIAPAMANEARGKLAKRLSELAPPKLNKVFFTNAGAEANEHAIRMAKLHTGRNKVMAAYRSYHGATSQAIALTGDPRRWGSEPTVNGTVRFHGPYLYRSAFYATTEQEESERALAHLREVLMYEGGHTIAAIILEPVVGTNGVLVPPAGYLPGVREICDEFGIVLIADEVMTGFGRMGHWFAVDAWGVEPDLITFAKGVNSGYVPLGGVIISDDIAATFADRVYPGGLTYSGHPLACASGVAALEVLTRDNIVQHVHQLGEEIIRPRLAKMVESHPSLGEARGMGMMWALELVKDKATREPYVPFNAAGPAAAPMQSLTAECKKRGLWPFVHFNRIHVVPPLVISEQELTRGLDILDEVLGVADLTLACRG